MSTFYHWRQIRLLQGMSCARCVKLGFTFPYWNTSEHLCLRKLSKKLRNLWQRRSDCCVKRHNFSRRCLKFLQASFLDLISLIEALSGESFLNWKFCKRTERKVYAQPQILLCTQFLENNNDNGRVITTWNLIELNKLISRSYKLFLQHQPFFVEKNELDVTEINYVDC